MKTLNCLLLTLSLLCTQQSMAERHRGGNTLCLGDIACAINTEQQNALTLNPSGGFFEPSFSAGNPIYSDVEFDNGTTLNVLNKYKSFTVAIDNIEDLQNKVSALDQAITNFHKKQTKKSLKIAAKKLDTLYKLIVQLQMALQEHLRTALQNNQSIEKIETLISDLQTLTADLQELKVKIADASQDASNAKTKLQTDRQYQVLREDLKAIISDLLAIKWWHTHLNSNNDDTPSDQRDI